MIIPCMLLSKNDNYSHVKADNLLRHVLDCTYLIMVNTM